VILEGIGDHTAVELGRLITTLRTPTPITPLSIHIPNMYTHTHRKCFKGAGVHEMARERCTGPKRKEALEDEHESGTTSLTSALTSNASTYKLYNLYNSLCRFS
jgi:hypothetical protein